MPEETGPLKTTPPPAKPEQPQQTRPKVTVPPPKPSVPAQPDLQVKAILFAQSTVGGAWGPRFYEACEAAVRYYAEHLNLPSTVKQTPPKPSR